MSTLIEELTVNPLSRAAYSGSDQASTDDLNTKYRPGLGTVEDLRAYFLLERKSSQFLYGRLALVAKANVGEDPLGEGVLTLEHITSALTMLNILNPVSDFSLDLSDDRFESLLDDLAGGSGAKVINPGDKTAILAFSLNQISRAEELRETNPDFPVPTRKRHVTAVRA